MTWTDDIDEVEIVLAREIVEMSVDKSETRTCSEMTKESASLDHLIK